MSTYTAVTHTNPSRRCLGSCLALSLIALTACTRDAAPPAPAEPAAGVSASEPAVPAQAGPAQAAWNAFLQGLDRDGDGVVDRSEHATAAEQTYAWMDRDGDDAVTVEEMTAQRETVLAGTPADTARRLAEVDANGDGHLDRDEHAAATRVVFDRYDRDGDARLVQEEFEAALAAEAEQAAAGG